jgi:hypothetical protein
MLVRARTNVTFSRVDPRAAKRTGDWVFFKQQDYGPAPP